jgi:hypothetical protein
MPAIPIVPEERQEEDRQDHRAYHRDGRFCFCPHEDLNLPRSYDEVVRRFERLQGARAMEALN